MACLKTTLALCLLGLVMTSLADDTAQTEQDDDTLERQERQIRRLAKTDHILIKKETPTPPPTPSCKCRSGSVVVSLSRPTCALKPV